jgi:protein O-GlcNAc transferase
LLRHQQGKTTESRGYIERAVALAPEIAAYRLSLAGCEIASGMDASVQTRRIEELLHANPAELADAFNQLGAQYLEHRRVEQAAEHFEKAISANADHLQALTNLAVLRLGSRRATEAVELLMRATAIDAEAPHANAYLAKAYQTLGRIEASRPHAERALRSAPELDEAWITSAVVAWKEGDAALCAARYARAIELAPHRRYLLQDCAQAYLTAGDLTNAAAMAWRAVLADPKSPSALLQKIRIDSERCDWHSFEADELQLAVLLSGLAHQPAEAKQSRTTDAVEPLTLLCTAIPPQLQLQNAKRYSLQNAPATLSAGDGKPNQAVNHGAKDERRIRIGYLTADLGEHPVMRLVAPVLEVHTKTLFEVHLFATRDAQSAFSARAKRAVEHFADCRQMSNAELLSTLQHARLDVLIDLSGYTRSSRSLVLHERAAPVQVSWLGFPGSLGLPTMDYLLADEHLIPSGSEADYSEKLLRLSCYQPCDAQREAARPTSRAAEGLREDSVVLVSFAQSYKWTPNVCADWAQILKRAPNTQLWLARPRADAEQNLRAFFSAYGVAEERIVFAPRADYASYLGRLQLADLMLDTQPYSSGATANDALWMGCPILTVPGAHYVSRMAASVLHAAELSGLVCPDGAAFVDKGVSLAANPGELASLRRKLEEKASAFFKLEVFMADYEAKLSAVVKAS